MQKSRNENELHRRNLSAKFEAEKFRKSNECLSITNRKKNESKMARISVLNLSLNLS